MFLCYVPGLSGDFIFDDTHTIVYNENIKINDLSLVSLESATQSFVGGNRQISMLSFAINHYFFADSSESYKTTNVILHILTGILVFFLTQLIFNHVPRPHWSTEQHYQLAPLIIATYWLLSPINLIPVLYVSQRMAQLSALFMLAGMLLYCASRQIKQHSYSKKSFLLLLAFLCWPLAYYSKENGILLPVFLILIEIIVFRNHKDNFTQQFRYYIEITLFIIIIISGLAWIVAYDPYGWLDGYQLRSFSLEERLLTQARSIVFYLNQLVLPINPLLGMWHDDFRLSTGLLKPWNTSFALVAIFILLITSIVFIRRATLLAFGILWFFVGHIVESSILPLELMHEHRNYFPSVGIYISFVYVLLRVAAYNARFGYIFIVLLISYFSTTLYMRAESWSDGFVHAQSEYKNHPNSPRASFSLASLFMQSYVNGYHDDIDVVVFQLQRSIDLERVSILPGVTLMIFQKSQQLKYSVGLQEDVNEKFRRYPNLDVNVAALRGLRQCIERNECRFENDELKTLYLLAENSLNYKIREEAALFYLMTPDQFWHGLNILADIARQHTNNVPLQIKYISVLASTGQYKRAERNGTKLRN